MKGKIIRISGSEALVSKVLEENLDSFYYSVPDYGTLFFMQAATGSAKFVYATSVYAGREIYTAISQGAELRMIVARGRVYVRNPYPLFRESGGIPGYIPEKLREKVLTLDEAVNKASEGVRDAFREYFGSLEPGTPDREMEKRPDRKPGKPSFTGRIPGRPQQASFTGCRISAHRTLRMKSAASATWKRKPWRASGRMKTDGKRPDGSSWRQGRSWKTRCRQ